MMEVRQQLLAECRDDIERIASVQWNETGDPGEPPAPDWNLYGMLEQSGALVMLTGHKDGAFAGYMGIIMHRQVNGPGRQATISTYWVRPGGDRALLLRRFFLEALGFLRERSISRLDVDTSCRHSCGRLLEAMGFVPRKVTYTLEA